MTKLSVNINKLATLRNSRGGNNPDLIKAARDIERFGADGITVHPHPHERHLRYAYVNELKKMFFDILQNPSISHQQAAFINELKNFPSQEMMPSAVSQTPAAISSPVLFHQNEDIHHHEEVEESLNIMDKEKELIIKALKKHKGKRKDAASDLGISERTLYRKLKEYDIKE